MASLPGAFVVLVAMWSWWLTSQLGDNFLPGPFLYGGLLVEEALAVAAALLLSPSMLAGTIAGEKDRGTMELLLVSPLSAFEIVVARLAGRFTQIGMYAAAGFPLLLLLATLCHDHFLPILMLAMLPMALAFGASGMTLAASTFARRGRDALMAIYLLEVLLIVAAFASDSFFSATVARWIEPLNPVSVIRALVYEGATTPAIITCLYWMLLGLFGIALASWQLRSAFLRTIGGKSPRRAVRRRRRVPPLVNRPMLWKELHIERDEFGRWLRLLLIAVLGAASIVLAAAMIGPLLVPGIAQTANAIAQRLSELIASTSTIISWLLQWAIGLRAAGSIALERQRSTWVALLTTPMSGREIVGSKTLGSLYALRWLAIVTLAAWTLAMIGGGLTVRELVEMVAFLIAGGTFMAAVGVFISSSNQNPTQSLATTMGTWMGAAITSAILAGMLTVGVCIIGMLAWYLYIAYVSTTPNTMTTSGGFPRFDHMGTIYTTIRFLLYLVATISIVQYLAKNFDRLAGRISRTSGEPAGDLYRASVAQQAEGKTPTADDASKETALPTEE